jgi:hypothetical protein
MLLHWSFTYPIFPCITNPHFAIQIKTKQKKKTQVIDVWILRLPGPHVGDKSSAPVTTGDRGCGNITSPHAISKMRCAFDAIVFNFFLLNFDLKNCLGLFKNSSDLIEIEWKCCGRKKQRKIPATNK